MVGLHLLPKGNPKRAGYRPVSTEPGMMRIAYSWRRCDGRKAAMESEQPPEAPVEICLIDKISECRAKRLAFISRGEAPPHGMDTELKGLLEEQKAVESEEPAE